MTHDIVHSGTCTLDGSTIAGATITVIDETNGNIEAVATSDADGYYELVVPEGTDTHFLFQYDDGAGNQYNHVSYPQYTAQGDTSANGNVCDRFADGVLSTRDDFATTTWGGRQPTSSYSSTTRPEWTIQNGSASVNADNELQFNQTDSDIITPSTAFDNMTWEFTIKRESDNGDLSFAPLDTNEGVDAGWFRQPYNGYNIRDSHGSYPSLNLIQQGGNTGLISEDGTPTPPYEFHVKLTRDASGNFEMFRDGTSIGTATDTTWTEADKVQDFVAIGERGTAVTVPQIHEY